MRGLNFLTLDITHVCNLNCSWCGKFSDTGSFVMSDADLYHFCSYAPQSPAENLRITGGDPLTHPKFREYIEIILAAVPKPIELATNGLWLPKYQDMIPLFKKIHITDYGEKNKWVILRYVNEPNVNVLTWDRYYSRDDDPNWNFEDAHRFGYDICALSQANIVGDRVYGCCVSEAICRHNGINPELTSVPLDDNWMKAFEARDMIAACQHCFIMNDVLRNGKGVELI